MSVLSNCNPNELKDAIAGILNDDRQRSVESHIAECKNCQQQLEKLVAEQSDWNKVSDYFLADEINTPYSLEPTVDIKLVQNGDSNSYEIAESSAEFSPDHGAILQPASHPEMLGRIDGFEIEQMIGQGGMGIVYKGFDTELNRPIAIKVLADHLASSGVARQRFAREARAAAAVIHPNVVPIHSVNSTAKRPYIVMTLVSGRSLQAHISEHGPMNVKDIVRIGKQIASGLAAAHREGLVHRDIKPANILLEKDVSRVMITDFGLARAADDVAITQTGWLAGTPHYMSPEQSTGLEVDARSDLFSLGSVLYFMCTGREPFRADIPVAVLQKIAAQEPVPIRAINSDVTQTLANLIDRLLSKKPDQRFQSAEEVEQILTQYLAHLEQPRLQPKPKFKKRTTESSRLRGVWLLALPALVMLTVLPFTIYMYMSTKTTPQTIPDFGLVSQQAWDDELNSIFEQINQIETGLDGSSNTLPPDPISIELEQLESTIQQMEQAIR